MKRELRLTFEDYVFYKTRFGESRTNLAYDRGVMLAYGIPQTGTDIVGLVVNGNGKPEADADGKFDQDKFKNFGFRVNQSIGSIASVGAYYYRGKEMIMTSNHSLEGGGEIDFENEITYWGPDFNIGVGPLELTGQYMERMDSQPYYGMKDIKSKGIIAELILAPQLDRSRYYFTGLYNKIESDLETHNYETATLSATFLVSRNLRLIAEYTRDLEFDKNRMTLGLVSGF